MILNIQYKFIYEIKKFIYIYTYTIIEGFIK